MDRLNHSTQRGRPVSSINAAKATDAFEHFISAGTLKTILFNYQNLCEFLHLKPNVFPLFYPKLKSNLNSWKAKALWKKFDSRLSHKCYARGKACPNTRVLIIGAGPCGLRTAIEAQLLGAKVVVIEKRDRMSRNNVLHLWPFVIEDLRNLGAKKFFGKFCAGAIDHISIRQLQCILFKVALLLGVEIHTEVSFEQLIEPSASEKIGWRAEFKPADHPVSQYEFDVIIGADGKRNTLQGFKRKEFRGKLAIAITANFINKRTEAEARVEEISGVAFIFNQKFFKELNATTGIDLENIVYYKDDTHYFVMTAKKHSLIDKGVIMQDFADTARLLSPDNVDREALLSYAREAADFSTNYQMPDLEFAVNHYGQPDVAMFDFTSMYAAENASKFVERNGYKLLTILVGDSLLEPFWPTGSGCARGFLSALDASWAIKAWGSGLVTPLEVLAERESIYRLLAQTTPENLNKDCKSYALDPSTRYPNLNKALLLPQQVLSLYDTDDPSGIELTSRTPLPTSNSFEHRKRRRRDIHLDPNTLLNWIKDQVKDYADLNVEDVTTSFRDGRVLCAIIHHYRPDLLDYSAIKVEEVAKNNQLAFDLLEKEIGIPPVLTGEDMANSEVPDYLTMFSYLTQIYDSFRGEIPHIKHLKLDLSEIKDIVQEKEIKAIKVYSNESTSAVINRNSNSLRSKRHLDNMSASTNQSLTSERKNKKRKSKYEAGMDRENRLPNQGRGGAGGSGGADEEFAARIKDLEDKWREPYPSAEKKPKGLMRAIGKIETSDWNIKEIEKKILQNKLGKSVNKEKERVPKWNREQFLARQTKLEKLDRQSSTEAKYSELDKGIKRLEQKLKEGSVRDLGQNKVATITEKLVPKTAEPEVKPVLIKTTAKPNVILPTPNVSEYCHFCQKRVYLMERLSAEGRFFHRGCFKCQYCHVVLRLGSYLFDREGMYGYKFYCTQHFGMVGEIENKTAKKLLEKLKENEKPLDKLKITPLIGFDGVDLLNRVQTPERIEFANLSAGHISSDHDESLSQMDEDEWTDRNFGASTGEICSSEDEDESTSLSGTESDNEDAFEEALEEPPTKEGTMRWMERYKQRYSKQHARDDDSESDDYSSSSDHSSYYENSTGDDEDGPVTEDEEEIRARELRKQEVRVEPPVIQTDTGSETEIVSDETTSSSSKHNSATEISTDSEFAVDDPTPTREIPSITFNDYNVTKTRGNYGPPKRVQVKSGILQTPINGKSRNSGIKLEFTPLVHSPIILSKPAPISLLTRTDGYALNRTQSTGGIATKVSLELKKKYLLGDTGIAGNIQKSGSVSALDSKFKSFHTNITDCQKLLKPSLDITPTPQSTCTKSPLSPVVSQSLPLSDQSSKSHDAVSPNVQSVKQKEVVAIIDLTSSPNQNNTQEGNEQPTSQPEDRDTFKHELEGRPRSPVEEIPIVVPTIDWSQVPKLKENGISSDSLTSDTESEEHSEIHQPTSNVSSNNIPCVQVHNDAGEMLHSWDNNIPLDSLNPVASKIEREVVTLEDSVKSIINDKKVLNQPKLLPELQKVHVHKDQNFIESGHSTPSEQDSFMDLTNAALTETELSDWARDGMVSDDFEDVEFEFNPRFVNSRKNKQPKGIPKSINKSVSKAKMEEFDDVKHVCGKEKQKGSLAENLNNLLSSLEFMDTGEETSSDEKVLVEANLKNNGYVEFQNEDEIIEDSLNPCINAIIETVNPEIRKRIEFDDLSSCDKNTGYCIIGNDDYSFGGQVIDLKKDDIQKMKEKQIMCDNEEDSLLILETGTTTEENTFSDSTVKNLIETGESEKKDSCDVVTPVVNDTKALPDQIEEEFKPVKEKDVINEDYQEHCQRLQSKVEFGNAKDSIDIRKSKRKEKLDFPLKPDLIQEEGPNTPNNKESLDDLLLVTPKIIYSKEQVQKVRDENQRLVQEMVMNKMKAQNRSLERKKRNRNSFSPNRSFDLKKSATTDITTAILNNENDNKRMSTYSTTSSVYSSPDIIKPLKSIEQKQILNITELNKNNENRFDNGNRDIYLSHVSSIKQHPKSFAKQLSVHSSFQVKSTNKPSLCSDMLKANSETSSLPDIQQALQDEFKTPTAPPRHKNFDIQKSTEKLKQDARARVRLKSNEDLGLSPEEKLKKLREKINRRGKENDHVDVHIQDSIESLVINTDKRNSLLYSNDTLKKKRSFHRSKSGENVLHSKTNSVNLDLKQLYPVRTKSVSELPNSLTVADESLHSKEETRSKLQFCKSDPNLLTDNYGSPDMKTKKGGIERRKSISKFISDLFGKKREGGLTSKGLLSRISPKAKSKSMSNLSGNNADKAKEEMTRTNSLSRISTQYRQVENASPPPIPPLPLNYTGTGLPHFNDDSTDGENDWKRHERSSCDTLDKSDVHRRSGKGSRRGSRQAQLKRHRMAQEIQRKLEETEVKTRELEQRGVTVEKALRGEISDAQTSKEECDLLKQWFDLMRELTELRRYEKELTVRADELELEDRHTRLQQQLRERLDNDGHKTKADVKVESNIISEMMDIVAKRDSLITVLEQDRIRYSEEDRDFEEQMLAKGLRLTSLQKSPNK